MTVTAVIERTGMVTKMISKLYNIARNLKIQMGHSSNSILE